MLGGGIVKKIKLKFDEEKEIITCVEGTVKENAWYAEKRGDSFDMCSIVSATPGGSDEGWYFYSAGEDLCDDFEHFDDLELYEVELKEVQ